MCGLAGVIDLGRREPNRAQVERMGAALFHRGHHVTLTAHWLILLCVLGLLSPKGRLAFFFVLAQLAILISMYFMPIVLWFALINGTFKDGRLRPGTLARSAAHVVLIAAGVLASLYALGFFHVDRQGYLMYPQIRGSNLADAPTDLERRMAAIAYARPRGNRDVDIDP